MSDDPSVTFQLPEPDQTQLSHSPLDVVVCQLQYDHNLAVADARTARALHDALGGRRGPYPRVEQIQTQTVSIGVGPGGATPAVNTNPVGGWRFSNEERTWVIAVVPEHVSVETATYTTWEEFHDALATVLAAVAEHVDPSFEQRLGVRYIDRLEGAEIERLEGWRDIISDHLLGPVLHPGFGPVVQAAQQQLLLALDDDGSQCSFRHGLLAGPGSPADYVLDYDLYREGTRNFDIEDALQAADRFNTYALQLFQASITTDYRETLA